MSGPVCANCSAPLTGRYCAECGQDARFRLSIADFAGQVVGGLFNLDSRMWRTLRGLCVPGDVAAEYLAGRRSRYMPPVQTYLVVALLFFAVLPIGFESIVINHIVRDEIERRAEAEGVSPQVESDRFAAANEFPSTQPAFQRGASRYSLLMFVTMPVLALLLHGVHLSLKRDYLEHLVVAVNLQTVGFAVAALLLAWEFAARAFWLPPLGWLWAAIPPLLLLYLLAAVWRVYAQRWYVAAVKGLTVTIAYLAILIAVGRLVAWGTD